MSAPWALQRRRPARPGRPPPRNRNRPARPASTPASASSNTAASAGSRPRALAPARKVSGAGLPCRCSRSRDHAVDPGLEQVVDARRDQDVAAVGAGRHDGAAQARVPDGLDVADRALVRLDSLGADHLQQELVLAVAQAVDGRGVGGIIRVALGQLDAPGGQERPGTVGPRLPVHVLVVVLDRVEGRERLPGLAGPLAQEVVEHLLPRGVVHLGGLGEHTVEVEETAADAIRETQHGLSVRDQEPAVPCWSVSTCDS